MKIEQLLLLSIFAVLVQAGPARSDCGVTKTFEAQNLCGVPYGGTWVECASGMTEMPTFLMPSCSITATQPDITATSTPAAIESSVPPAITPAPIYEDPLAPKAGNETYGCRAQWVCVDALASCGDVSTRYGSCFNTCTNEGILSTPPCTIAPEPTHAADHQHGPPEPKPESPAPPREHPDFCDEKPYMCAPLGW